MYIPSSKKDVIFTVVFCLMFVAIVFLWRAKNKASDQLYWSRAEIHELSFKIDSLKLDLNMEKVNHAYTTERLELEKSMRSLEKEAVAAIKRLNAKENK